MSEAVVYPAQLTFAANAVFAQRYPVVDKPGGADDNATDTEINQLRHELNCIHQAVLEALRDLPEANQKLFEAYDRLIRRPYKPQSEH